LPADQQQSEQTTNIAQSKQTDDRQAAGRSLHPKKANKRNLQRQKMSSGTMPQNNSSRALKIQAQQTRGGSKE